SLKDLAKALSNSLPITPVPLPDDLLLVLHAYLDKHPEFDDAESQRLQEELLSVYQGDTELKEDAIKTSSTITESLLDVWLKKQNAASIDFDEDARFIENQVQMILLAFGRRRPKDFLTTINKFFVKKESRILALSLLCEFFRHQPPHLYQLLETPLFENLLRCLQVDTSTRVISLAMTALIMFLPHIPSSLGPHLPALFNIYSRMLFWDKERRATTEMTLDEEQEKDKTEPPPNHQWDKLSYLLESDDETVPELLHYFTFLYGLYPLNFMSYIRKPQRYLRHADVSDAEELDQPLMEQGSETTNQSGHTSWQNVSTPSPDGRRISGLQRTESQNSQSVPSVLDSPSLRANDRRDSPTLPPHILGSAPQNPLHEMLASPKSTRDSLSQALTNDSVVSLSLSQTNNDNAAHVDAYLQSLSRDQSTKSPSVHPRNVSPELKVAYLHREIQLLRNDLNFERYLKQQHLSHIGQLHRKQLREARVEAETQNLINLNRRLKVKFEDVKNNLARMKKETEKSKLHSRKWETDLSAKVKTLREEQKKWVHEKEDLQRELEKMRTDNKALKNLVLAAEKKELDATQRMQSIESNLDELERLRAEVDKLTITLRTYEAGE
ncbi:hypothetical protein OIDMADRAFT_89532, partial [Oidiodendron maius Zn]